MDSQNDHDPYDSKAIQENQRIFLHHLGGKVLSLEDSPLSMKAQFEKILRAIELMGGENTFNKSEKFSLATLIYLIDEIIIECDLLKNKLIELKWWISLQRSFVYRQNKED